MRWRDGYIAVDWGTTNRRAYVIDGAGRIVREHEDDRGVLSVEPGGFPAAAAEIRDRLGDLPLLLAGMVGSNRGWVEAPYVQCPAGVSDIAERLVWADPERSAILPGLSWIGEGQADVMRGEEVQLFGAVAAGLVPPTCLVCHPGTHNKWVRVEGGRVARFRTVMTGEMFNLLRDRGILSELLSAPVEPGEAFSSGVRKGLEGGLLTAELFAVRARVLLGEARRENASAFTSGLLIGGDLRAGLEGGSSEVFVMGRPELTRLYAAALVEAGANAREVDGESAFVAGIKRIVEQMR